jgi:hypothetical protein
MIWRENERVFDYDEIVFLQKREIFDGIFAMARIAV